MVVRSKACCTPGPIISFWQPHYSSEEKMNATCQRTVNCVSGCVVRADYREVGLCTCNWLPLPYHASSLPMPFLRIVGIWRRWWQKRRKTNGGTDRQRDLKKVWKETNGREKLTLFFLSSSLKRKREKMGVKESKVCFTIGTRVSCVMLVCSIVLVAQLSSHLCWLYWWQ